MMRLVSFFSGCGGLDLGFEQAGFDVVWANELEPHCKATYVRNHPNTVFKLGDVRNIETTSIPDCDGFIGGPPCQSWSIGGKQGGINDERGLLFVKYIELIKEKQPKFFVIENVKGMLDEKFKNVLSAFMQSLDCAGYDVHWALLNAVNYSVPQNRERIFFVGFRKDLNMRYEFPLPTCAEPVNLNQAIGDIQEFPRKFYGRGNCEVEEISHHGVFLNHDVLCSKFGPFYYRGNRRRGWHQPSFTINATADFAPLHPSSPKMVYFGRENWNFQKGKMDEYRRLSVRECARIQTFPDDFCFEYENIKDAYKMIGNAVPPRLGYEIAKSILTAFKYKEVTTAIVGQSVKRTNTSVLVGYYKGAWHKQLILKNRLYYVRSDGRKGSLFKEDCSAMPKYLLLHHKDEVGLYELDEEEPILVDASFLKTLGFDTTGGTHLCFRLKDVDSKNILDLEGFELQPKYKNKRYSPYFTSIDKIFRT